MSGPAPEGQIVRIASLYLQVLFEIRKARYLEVPGLSQVNDMSAKRLIRQDDLVDDVDDAIGRRDVGGHNVSVVHHHTRSGINVDF